MDAFASAVRYEWDQLGREPGDEHAEDGGTPNAAVGGVGGDADEDGDGNENGWSGDGNAEEAG